MPSASKGGSPVYLFGTDDYMNVADNDLLDFVASESLSAILISRQWVNTSGYTRYLEKGFTGSVNGYSIQSNSSSRGYWTGISSSSGTNGIDGIGHNDGSINTFALVVDRQLNTLKGVLNGSTSTLSVPVANDLANPYPLRVGTRSTELATYGALEFTAAAVFRRALTPAEITTISNYYTNRVK